MDCWRLPRAFVRDSDLHVLFIPGSCPAEQKGISYSLAFFAHFSLCFSRLILDCVRSVFLVSQNDLSREFQRSSLSRDLPGGSILLLLVGCRIYRCENSEFLWRLKLEACDYSSYLYLNEWMGYVDLLNFHENWLNVLQILTHKILWRFNGIRNIFSVTSWNVATTEMSSIAQLQLRKSLTHFGRPVIQ